MNQVRVQLLPIQIAAWQFLIRCVSQIGDMCEISIGCVHIWEAIRPFQFIILVLMDGNRWCLYACTYKTLVLLGEGFVFHFANVEVNCVF